MPIEYGKGSWIQTYSHHKFHPFDPRPEDIFIEDIAHALSMICRFTGHTRKFYSVAQHSALVSRYCRSENKLWGLLHDASEAYICDMSRPVKHHIAMIPYIEIEKNIMKAVCKRFGLDPEEPQDVKEWDAIVGMAEAKCLMGPLLPGWATDIPCLPAPIVPLSPEEAENMFMTQILILQAR